MDIKLQDKYGLYINGEWVDPKSEEWLESTNPANGNKLAKIANASEEDVDLAIDAATEAFWNGGWKDSTPEERAKLLFKIADIIDEAEKGERPALYGHMNDDVPEGLPRIITTGGTSAYIKIAEGKE